MVDTVGPACTRYEHRAHLPELARYDGIGRRIEEVRFDADYHRAGAAVWQSGLVAESGTPGRAYEQATLLYLLSLEGEAGHACPAVCTIGLARALRRAADPAIRDRFLPPLLETDYALAQRGSQFLTEVQGGSDVGANATIARPRGRRLLRDHRGEVVLLGGRRAAVPRHRPRRGRPAGDAWAGLLRDPAPPGW